jgi:hypothetical protein
VCLCTKHESYTWRRDIQQNDT